MKTFFASIIAVAVVMIGINEYEINRSEKPSKTPVDSVQVDAKPVTEKTIGADLTQFERRDVLWLARVGYSETKRSHEQVLVMWVVRNRVETGYKGNTYKDVALSPSQFSGLHPGPHNDHYEHNMSLDFETTGNSAWTTALKIAIEVYSAPKYMRPFPITTRHFYSPNAIDPPLWALNHTSKAIQVTRDRDAPSSSSKHIRFAFYDGVR